MHFFIKEHFCAIPGTQFQSLSESFVHFDSACKKDNDQDHCYYKCGW